MIHFVVVAGSPEAIDRLSPRLAEALDATRTFAGDPVQLLASDRTWAAAGISMTDPTCQARLVGDANAMVSFNGPALNAHGHQGDLGAAILQAFRMEGSAGVSRILGGTYNVVGAAPRQGVRAFGDFSGTVPLYWYQGSSVAIFSNRSTTVAHLAGTSGWDPRALAWLIGHANLFGERMPACDVQYLPPGYEAHVAPGAVSAEIARNHSWVWPPPSQHSHEDLGSDTWDHITDDLVKTFRSFATFREPINLGLTGGKDSRLCLALAKAAGLEDHLRTTTNGRADSPEVEVAATVADAAGFQHRRTGPPTAAGEGPPPTPTFTPDHLWRRLRQHAYRYDATVCPWDGNNDRLTSVVVGIRGFGGELYRGSHSKRFKTLPSDIPAMAEMFVDYHQPHDPLGILPEREAAYQATWLRNWVHETSSHVRFDLLPVKFYVDYRLGHWNGPMSQGKAGRIDLLPLLSERTANQFFRLSARASSEERFHYEVMRRAAPELLAVPFLGDRWAPRLVEESPSELPTAPYQTKVRPTPQSLTSWQWQFLGSEGPAMRALFIEADRHTAMGDVVNMRKLKKVARHAADISSLVEAKSLLSSVTVALALVGRAEPVVDVG